jgi:hypothetical protein
MECRVNKGRGEHKLSKQRREVHGKIRCGKILARVATLVVEEKADRAFLKERERVEATDFDPAQAT